MLALFEKCSSTSENQKSPVKPVQISLSAEKTYQLIHDDVVARELYGAKFKQEFFEIYYWYVGFEVSINILRSEKDNKTFINIMVYGEKKRGRTRSMLKRLISYYQEMFKDYLV